MWSNHSESASEEIPQEAHIETVDSLAECLHKCLESTCSPDTSV